MTGGETAARLLGAVTLLALFAPSPEGADATKRKFGAEGVAVCSALLEGEQKEGNPVRRIGLIMARAIHRIEVKDYDGAHADVTLAREEAATAGLMADPYYARSRGRSFDEIDAAIAFRQGRSADAQALVMNGGAVLKHSIWQYATVTSYSFDLPTASDVELRYLEWGSRAGIPFSGAQSGRLDELGRFAESARLRDALIDFDKAEDPDERGSAMIASAALAHALAGDKVTAAARAADARANFDARRAAGKPENEGSAFVELMDLYGIVTMINDGDLKGARRLFAARSAWLAASFGSVLEVNRRLRVGAAPDELIGGLAKDAQTLWKERADTRRAAILAKDGDNKTLFTLINPMIPASSYETLSKTVWRTDKTLVIKPTKANPRTSKTELLVLPYNSWPVTLDAYRLHAAALARSRGHEGFVITPIFGKEVVAATIFTGNRGAPGLPEPLFNSAAEVIADMTPILPDPQTLKGRRAAKPKI